MKVQVEVIALKPMHTGNLRAFVSVKIGSVVIHDFRIVKQENQVAYVQPPQRTFIEDGKVKFSGPLVEFPVDVLDRIKETILLKWGDANV